MDGWASACCATVEMDFLFMEFRRVGIMVTCKKLFGILFVSAVKQITVKAILAGLGTFFQTDKQFVRFAPGLRPCILGTGTQES